MRKKSCSHGKCSNNQTNYNKAFFTFPTNPDLCKKWVEACGRKNLLSKSVANLRVHFYVCREHFHSSQLVYVISPFKPRLKNGVVPCTYNKPGVRTEKLRTLGLVESFKIRSSEITNQGKMPAIKKCSFKNCNITSNNCENAFFLFPRNEELRFKWIEASKNMHLLKLTSTTLEKKRFVCSDHFTNSDYSYILSPFKRKLQAGAIPKEVLSKDNVTIISPLNESLSSPPKTMENNTPLPKAKQNTPFRKSKKNISLLKTPEKSPSAKFIKETQNNIEILKSVITKQDTIEHDTMVTASGISVSAVPTADSYIIPELTEGLATLKEIQPSIRKMVSPKSSQLQPSAHQELLLQPRNVLTTPLANVPSNKVLFLSHAQTNVGAQDSFVNAPPPVEIVHKENTFLEGKYDTMIDNILKAEDGDPFQILMDITFGYLYRHIQEAFDDKIRQKTLANLQRWIDMYKNTLHSADNGARKVPYYAKQCCSRPKKYRYASATEEEKRIAAPLKHSIIVPNNTPTPMATETVPLNIHYLRNDTVQTISNQNKSFVSPLPHQRLAPKQNDAIGPARVTGLLLAPITAAHSSLSRNTIEPKRRKDEGKLPTVVTFGNLFSGGVSPIVRHPTGAPIDTDLEHFEKSTFEENFIPNTYSWTQTESVVDVKIDVSDHVVHTQQISVDLTCNALSVREENLNETELITLLEGHLPFSINLEASSYSLNPGNYIEVSLVKKAEIYWDQLLQDEMAMEFEDSIT